MIFVLFFSVFFYVYLNIVIDLLIKCYFIRNYFFDKNFKVCVFLKKL